MYVEFKRLSFSNILSYGAAGAEIEFKNGFNTISAVNGSGKSTILDALTFALFGKPYRNIKLGELVNMVNGKGLEVSVDFKIKNDLYTITRGLKPTKFEILKNGKEMDLLSSKKLNQDEIDKILGINYRLFKNIVAMGVTNNKAFLSLPVGEKRALIENIFNIDVLGLMCKDVKKRKTVESSELNLKITELSGIKRQIEDNEDHIATLKNYIDSFNQIKATNIERITTNIGNYESRISKAVNNIDLANKKIKELTEKLPETAPDQNALSALDRQIGTVESNISRIEGILEKLKKSPVCPVCNSPLDKGHAKQHVDELKSELQKDKDETLPELKKSYKELQQEITDYTKNRDFIVTIENKKRIEESTKSTLETELLKEKASLETENKKECPAQTTDTEEKIKELNKSVEKLDLDITGLEETIAIDNELVNILGDDGIKTYFFRKLTGILNKSVNEYLIEFELKNTELKFNEQMEETFTVMGYDRSYESFSAGERTRIDMAILLAFFDISRIISNWSCNFCVIDELLDNGIDKSGIRCFINTLKKMISSSSKKLGIYIISHKLGEMNVEVNSTIEIKKEHDFSILRESHE